MNAYAYVIIQDEMSLFYILFPELRKWSPTNSAVIVKVVLIWYAQWGHQIFIHAYAWGRQC